jgi:hypothetical protein
VATVSCSREDIGCGLTVNSSFRLECPNPILPADGRSRGRSSSGMAAANLAARGEGVRAEQEIWRAGRVGHDADLAARGEQQGHDGGKSSGAGRECEQSRARETRRRGRGSLARYRLCNTCVSAQRWTWCETNETA